MQEKSPEMQEKSLHRPPKLLQKPKKFLHDFSAEKEKGQKGNMLKLAIFRKRIFFKSIIARKESDKNETNYFSSAGRPATDAAPAIFRTRSIHAALGGRIQNADKVRGVVGNGGARPVGRGSVRADKVL